jgi:hypothetical protein
MIEDWSEYVVRQVASRRGRICFDLNAEKGKFASLVDLELNRCGWCLNP